MKLSLTLAILMPVLAAPVAAAPGEEVARIPSAKARVVTFAEGLENPWGIALLPDGRALVTERPGRLRLIAADGKLSPPLSGVPEVLARAQGGLLDVVLAPDFAKTQVIYFSYAEPGEGGAGTAVARARLGTSGLSDVQVIYRQQKVGGGLHFGSRLVFAPDGTLFVTQGERFTQKEKAQDLSTGFGKLVRINADGSIPKDNPFVGKQGARPEIWSYGHRNMQGADLHPTTGEVWTNEHGAQGGDELNRPQPGKNYGWPVITYGKDYSGAKIGIGTSAPGMEQPIYYWDPSIAPSGLEFYTGDAFPAWKGDAFIGSLKFGLLVRLDMDGEKVVKEERLLEDIGERIRDVRQGPDGFLYLLTDSSEGRVLQIRPQ
jgi:glucose/arabinose dehydrogenase